MTKLVIGVLNHNRFGLLKRTIDSTVDSIGPRIDVKWILWDNGSNPDVVEKIKKEYSHLFYKMNFRTENEGIGAGLKGLQLMALETAAPYYMHLENDWLCVENDWLQDVYEILDMNEDIGIVKLRARNDGQYEMMQENINNGTAALYSPWWLSPIPDYVNVDILSSSRAYYFAKVPRGYTNNPHVRKLEMTKNWEFNDSVKGYGLEEEEIEELPALTGWKTANLVNGPYVHIG